MKLQDLFSCGTYVGLLPTGGTEELLEAWAASQGLQLPNDLHVTVLFSRRPLHVSLTKDEHRAHAIGFRLLGKALVMQLDAPTIEDRHDQLRAQGGTHDFPEFIAHMTLQADGFKGDPQALQLPNFGLAFEREYVEALDLN